MKIVVCAVPFSDNLGDGVIYQTLADLIRQEDMNVSVTPLDIAGRSGFGQPSLKQPGVVLLLNHLPSILRRVMVVAVFTLKFMLQWRKRWLQELADADYVVIGGGQLFSDADLNFPIKLFLLSTLLKHKRCAVLFVGISSRWSGVGRFLIRRFIANARPESWVVRDQESLSNLQRVFQVPMELVRVAPDPVTALGKVFTKSVTPPGRKRLGLGVSDPHMLAYSAAQAKDYSTVACSEAYSHVAAFAVKHGWEVYLFTNGAREDNDYLETIRNRSPFLAALDNFIPRRPEELVEIVAGCDLLVAHRMHANIIAFALGIPSLGFNWDDKVTSFFRLAGRGTYVLEDITDPRLIEVLGRVLEVPESATADPVPLAERVAAEISSFIDVQKRVLK